MLGSEIHSDWCLIQACFVYSSNICFLRPLLCFCDLSDCYIICLNKNDLEMCFTGSIPMLSAVTLWWSPPSRHVIMLERCSLDPWISSAMNSLPTQFRNLLAARSMLCFITMQGELDLPKKQKSYLGHIYISDLGIGPMVFAWFPSDFKWTTCYTPLQKKRNTWFRGSCAPIMGPAAPLGSDIVSRGSSLEFEP